MSQIAKAIKAATNVFAEQQLADGGWPAGNHAGPALTGFMLVAENVLGTLNEQEANNAIHWMRSLQREDGSFPGYPYANVGSINASARVYAGMIAAGVSEQDDALVKAKHWIDQQGGFNKVDANGKLYLALAGLFPPNKLPPAVMFMRLIPGIDKFISKRLVMIFALALNTLTPITYALQKNGGAQVTRDDIWKGFIKKWEAKKYQEYLFKHQNPDGDWTGVVEMTLWGLLALHFLEVPRNDARFQKGLNAISQWKKPIELGSGKRGLEVITFDAKVWNTALMMRALMLTNDAEHETRIESGIAFLIREQYDTPIPHDWQNPAPGAPRCGGWAFEENNPTSADPDSTSVVLNTLGLALKNQPDNKALVGSVKRGQDWMLGMQNPDGGWPSFTWGQKSKPPGPMFTKPMPEPKNPLQAAKLLLCPPAEFRDPSCSDETGRILMALGTLGLNTEDEVIQKAIAFLKYERADNGVWWGRWGVNYLLTTAYIISGLCAVGEDMNASYCKHAINWMLDKQNKDGGWGEVVESYADPSLAGTGPSLAVVTGRVLVALMEAGMSNDQHVSKGINYLVSNQQDDGVWEEIQCIGTVLPPDMFYTNYWYTQFAPVEALIKYSKTNA